MDMVPNTGYQPTKPLPTTQPDLGDLNRRRTENLQVLRIERAEPVRPDHYPPGDGRFAVLELVYALMFEDEESCLRKGSRL
jgi:hypothetical protein